jgi:hypothetical protein
MDCYYALFQDAVYEHSDDITYSFKNGAFIRRNRVAVINRIKDMLNIVYDIFIQTDSSFKKYSPLVNYPALLSVLTRYSRDIYGFRRIAAKIRDLPGKIDDAQREQLEQIISEGADFGFKIPSEHPYIERQAAVLLYWFSVLKPFHLQYEIDAQAISADIQAYFNEYLSYYLICLGLKPQSVDLEIHKDKALFKEFLNQLHYRNLSRSSLEFFLPYTKN